MTDDPGGRIVPEERHSALFDANAFCASIADFDRYAPGLNVTSWLGSRDIREGRVAVAKVVTAYADISDDRQYYSDRRLFDPEADEGVGRGLDGALWSIVVASMGGGRSGFDVDNALRLAFGRDPVSRAFGASIDGRLSAHLDDPLDFGDFPPVPFDDRIPFEELQELGCYVGLGDAVTNLSIAARSVGRIAPYPGMKIRGLDPPTGCPDDVIRVLGSGFGRRRPSDAIVVFGSTSADVVTWSDTEISVRVPHDVSESCVSVLKVPEPATGAEDTFTAAVSELSGVIAECFGLMGASVAAKLDKLGRAAPGGQAEAVCAPDGSNKFIGGVPRITSFRTRGGDTSPQRLNPGQPVELQWSIVNARSATIRIARRPGTSPLAVTPALPSWFMPNPLGGSVVLPTTPGLVPWTIDVELRATNACGAASSSLEIRYDPAPGLVFVGGGTRSSFDLGVIEALGGLLAGKPSVCAGSGMGALSAASAAADYPNPTSLRTFWDSSPAWYLPILATLSPGGDYQAMQNAEWEARVRAEVLTMDALGLLRRFIVPYRPADGRLLESVIASIAGVGADKAMDALSSAVQTALEEAGQAALSSVPIVAIIWAAAKFGIAAFRDSLTQQTANVLATVPATFDDTALRTRITSAMVGIQNRLDASGCRLRIPLTNLERGHVLYGLEKSGVSEAPVGSQIRANASIETMVQASATVPLLGAPKAIGGESYLDGALCDPVPLGAAIEAGAGAVIVSQPHIRLVAEEPSYLSAGLPRIDARTSVVRDLQSLEGALNTFGRFARDSVTRAPVGSWRVPLFVIEPTVDVVGLGASIGQLGLVNVMSDYGYMRTFDSLVPWLLFPQDDQRSDHEQMRAELSRSSDKIVALRLQAWEWEHNLNGYRSTPLGAMSLTATGLVRLPEQSAIDDIRTTKRSIRSAILDRLAITGRFELRAAPRVPAGTITFPAVPRPRAETWVQGWEKHDFEQVVAPVTANPAMPDGDPWVALTYAGQWTEPAGARPAAIWGP
jgi:predicted acylesterase/phospholipase RssA